MIREDSLKEKLFLAIEALKFYASEENYYMREVYGKTEVREDNGKKARECLKMIEGENK